MHPSSDSTRFVGRSSAHDSDSAEGEMRRNMEDMRHDANVESKTLIRLESFGIPWNDVHCQKSEQTTLSASNVDKDFLKKLRWEFYETYDDLCGEEPAAWDALTDVREVWYTIRRNGLGGSWDLSPLKIPSDWATHTDHRSVTFQCLQLHLRQLPIEIDEAVGETVVFCPREEVVQLRYPAANVTLNESVKHWEDPAAGIEWRMFAFLSLPAWSVCSSELDVKRHIGSCLAGLFHIDNCVTSSGTELKFPTAIGCFGSFSKPDFAARIDAPHIKQHLRPIVILGEAKRDFYTYTSRSEAHMQTVAAQLAWSAQPTLTIMIMAAMDAHQRQMETTNGSKNTHPFRLPEHTFIYGIAYGAFGFVVYSFFPRVTRADARGRPTEWGYGCATADAEYVCVFEDQDSEERLRAIRALLVVQRHAIRLSEELRNVQIPEELVTCHDLWDKRNLWSN